MKKIAISFLATILFMVANMANGENIQKIGRFVVEEVDQSTLSKEQLVRLRCVEIIHGTNAHAGIGTNEVEVSEKAAKQIKEMTEWCEDFVLVGSRMGN